MPKKPEITVVMHGLNQRDYFAAAALTGMLSNPSSDSMENERVAAYCYQIADAMLKERAWQGKEAP